ncbi:MAG TPA: dodecin [Pseudomonadales bacterium]|nr:dodecin [Pseudomonadales bacterium]
MSSNVYKITEVVGSSTESQEDAIRAAIRRTARTIDHLQWFEVAESRGFIEDGDVAYWQVKVKIGFTLND